MTLLALIALLFVTTSYIIVGCLIAAVISKSIKQERHQELFSKTVDLLNEVDVIINN